MKTILILALLLNFSFASVLDDYLDNLKQEVKKTDPNFTNFDVKRGEKIFTSKHIGKKGKEISCTSCHGIDLTKENKNFFTGKVIEPLAPSSNPKRFTKIKDIEKWIKRNFNDVYNREGTALEKGDVVTYITKKDKK